MMKIHASTWLALIVAAGQAPFRLDTQQLIAWTGAANNVANQWQMYQAWNRPQQQQIGRAHV